MTDNELEQLAAASEGDFRRRRRVMQDFRYDEQQEKYWDVTTGILLGARSVDGAVHRDDWPRSGGEGEQKLVLPSIAINNIDSGLTVEGSTWWPGKPCFIQDVVMDARGVVEVKGAVTYNGYMAPPKPALNGDVDAGPWIEHVTRLYPDVNEHEHFFDFAAHALQRPWEKVNHGIVMAGGQGIGKDTALLPVRRGVGEWNAAEVGPDAVTSAYNGYVRSVLLVINEVRPHDEDHKASNFYNLLKPILAAPPDMLPMTLKYANTIYVRNLCHVVLTTNDPLSMFIPEEDRRLFVMTSSLRRQEAFPEGYFDRLHRWLAEGGCDRVIAWLLTRDLSGFQATTAPPDTTGRTAIIQSAQQVRRSLVDEVFEQFVEQVFRGERPEVFFHRDLTQFVGTCLLFDDAHKVIDALNARNFHFKMADRGYDMHPNPDAMEWKHGKFRTRMAFVRRDVPTESRLKSVVAALSRRPLEMNRVES